jgi:hypothetical protein
VSTGGGKIDARKVANARRKDKSVSAEKIRYLGLEVHIVNRRVRLPSKEGTRKENFKIENTIGELIGEQCNGRTMVRCDFESLEDEGEAKKGRETKKKLAPGSAQGSFLS